MDDEIQPEVEEANPFAQTVAKVLTEALAALRKDGTIEVHYQDAPGDGAGTHSAGIENQDGTIGLQYYLGLGPLPGTPIAVQYTPSQVNEAMASDTATVQTSDPDITFTPASFFSAQLENTVVVQNGTLGNVGMAELDWQILEAPATVLPPSARSRRPCADGRAASAMPSAASIASRNPATRS